MRIGFRQVNTAGSFYARLFKYRARSDRLPLENFLTEALADLLNRMPRNQTIGFLTRCFGDAHHALNWDDVLGSDLEWRTQVVTDYGIIDAVLYSNMRPLIVLESKTWSSFRDHSTDLLNANQVSSYCTWLRSQVGPSGTGAALVISASAETPEGYKQPGYYALETRGQTTWASFGRWLDTKEVREDLNEATAMLASEFHTFLKEQNLSNEVIAQVDVAALALLIPSWDRWEATFAAMWSAAEEVQNRFLSKKASSLYLNGEAGMLWQWRYGQSGVTPERFWIAVGLRFPESSQWYHAMRLPNAPHFLMIVACDNAPLSRVEFDLPTDWHFDEEDGEYVCVLPIHTLSASSDKRLLELGNWAHSAMLVAERISRSARVE